MIKIICFTVCICLFTACHSVPQLPAQKIVRLNIFTEPPSLDPRKATDSTSMNVLLNLFEGLTRISDDHLPYPAVAERIEISEDQRTYTFTLRDASWSNGDPVTAEDFVYTWQSILDPAFPSPFAYKLYVIENAADVKLGHLPLTALAARALDSKTLQVTLKYPTPYFLELIASPTFYPISKKIDLMCADWASESTSNYVSNGPFQLKEWIHESEILATKNPQYWDAECVKLDALHLSMIDDTTTEFYMFEMNELDWAGSPLSSLPPELIPAFEQETQSKFQVNFYPATGVYYYKINTLQYPLCNVNIRKALSYAINRKDIVEHVTQMGQTPATALIPPMPGWPEESHLFEDSNEQLAQKFFASGIEELGIKQEEFPKLTLSFNTNREHQKIAQAIQQQWKERLNIDVELLHFDWKVYLAKISNQDYQIARMGWVGDFHDAISFLEPFKHKNDSSTFGNNDTGWENAQYIAYLDAAERELDLTKRVEILRKAEALLISEMPILPIYYVVQGYLKKPYLHGVYVSPLGIADFKQAFIDD